MTKRLEPELIEKRKLERYMQENTELRSLIKKYARAGSFAPEQMVEMFTEILKEEKQKPFSLSFSSTKEKSNIKSKSNTDHAECAVLVWSDWHISEVVKLADAGKINSYNSLIASNRIAELVRKNIKIINLHQTMYPIEKIWLTILGDMINGSIHPELILTNDLSDPAAAILCSRLLMMAIEELKTLNIPIEIDCVVGNHPRMMAKMPTKIQSQVSFDWMIYEMLADYFRDDPLIKIRIHPHQMAVVEQLGWKFVIEHGIDVKNAKEEEFEDKVRAILDDPVTRKATGNKGASFDNIIIGNMHKAKFLERTTVNGCFLPGMLITMADGTRKPIESIIEHEDFVLSKGGGINKVDKLWVNSYDGGMTAFRTSGTYGEIQCTDNHRIWAFRKTKLWGMNDKFTYRLDNGNPEFLNTIEPKYIEAADLAEGDYVHLPFPNHEGTQIDLEWARFVGLYLAEGSASGRNGLLHHINFTFHEREEEYAFFVEKVCIKMWGRATKKLRVRNLPNGTIGKTWEVSCSSSEAAKLMVMLCGKGAKNKIISEEIMQWSKEAHAQLLAGWVQGDGHVITSRVEDKGRIVSSTSISKSLSEQMFIISLRAGVIPTLSRLSGGGPRRPQDAYTITWRGDSASRLIQLTGEEFNGVVTKPSVSGGLWINGQAFVPIKSIYNLGHFKGTVYNLRVENDHSYTVNGVGVANCLVGNSELGVAWRLKPVKASQSMFGISKGHCRTWSYIIDVSDIRSEKNENNYSVYTKQFIEKHGRGRI